MRFTPPAPAYRRNICLPVVLDVGTNNEERLNDPLYLGLRQHRVRGDEYMTFVDEFVDAVLLLYPQCCIQWEDFANINAVPLLARYRDKICSYNDDISGHRSSRARRDIRCVAPYREETC